MSVAYLPSFQTYGRQFHQRDLKGFAVSVGAHGAGHCIPAHRHADEYVWCVLLDGALEETTAARCEEAAAGSMLVRSPDCIHANRFSTAPGLCLNLFPSRTWLAANRLDAIGDIYLHQRTKSALLLGREIVGELGQDDARSGHAIEALLLELLSRAARVDGFERAGRARWFALALDEIESNLGGDLSLSDLARHCGVSAGHLARSFRATLGKSLGEHVRERRLERAAEMIRGSRRTLAQIADAVGFCDQAHFSRAFKARFKTSPAAFREQDRK